LSTLVLEHLKHTNASSNNITLAADGSLTVDTSVLHVDATNNRVGIGTTSPTQSLETTGSIFVNSSGNPFLEVKTSGAGNNPFIRIKADTNYWDVQSLFSNTNDELDFRYNGASKMMIDSTGRVTKPNQPSFYAYPSGNQAYPINQWNTVQFNTISWNIGGHYNTSNYRWTVPVAGKYLINWMLQLENTNQPNWIYAYPIVNGNRNTDRSRGKSFSDFKVFPTYHTESGSWIMNLSANDYVTFDIYTPDSNKQFKAESHWSGILLG
tara:strand:+ start:29 stop:826 length:798 start_codon:yes stop_codon:yes gene_type:complete